MHFYSTHQLKATAFLSTIPHPCCVKLLLKNSATNKLQIFMTLFFHFFFILYHFYIVFVEQISFFPCMLAFLSNKIERGQTNILPHDRKQGHSTSNQSTSCSYLISGLQWLITTLKQNYFSSFGWRYTRTDIIFAFKFVKGFPTETLKNGVWLTAFRWRPTNPTKWTLPLCKQPTPWATDCGANPP